MELVKGKNILITGASRGIGKGIAQTFAQHGANVAFTYSSSAGPAEELEQELTALGVKGDPIIGTTTKDAVQLLMEDDETECIVMIGEIGGQLEADAANWIKAQGNPKPVVGFIAGETAPKGRTMGHAGAIVGGNEDTAEAKKAIMKACGIHVVDSPAAIGKTVAKALA